MSEKSRDQRVADAFVAVADTLIADFDIIDLLHTLVDECVNLLDVDAGGLLLTGDDGHLQLVASSSEQAHLVEVIQLGAGEGPCVDAYRTGRAVTVGDIRVESDSWPAFRDAALAQGFHAVFATPMRLRGHVIGALNLFSKGVGGPTEQDAVLAQALADIATIGILQEQGIRDTNVLNAQLQRALESRVLIEQAKGVIAAVGSLDMNESFTALRNYARAHSVPLRDLALQVAERTPADLVAGILQQNGEPANAGAPRPREPRSAPKS